MAELNTDTLTVGGRLTVTAPGERAITLKPRSTIDTAPMVWYDQYDRKLASIEVQEYNEEGEWLHRLVVSTANASRSQLVPRFTINFGTDDPVVGFADSRLRFDGEAAFLELKSANGSYWRIGVDDAGDIVSEEAPDIDETPVFVGVDVFLTDEEGTGLLDELGFSLIEAGNLDETLLYDEVGDQLTDEEGSYLFAYEFVEAGESFGFVDLIDELDFTLTDEEGSTLLGYSPA